MPFQICGELRYYQFGIFERNLCQGIFTRLGGISPAPWASLNLGGTVGDEAWRVSENRSRVLQALGRDVGSVYDAWQVHGAQVAIADAPRSLVSSPLQADVLLTDKPAVTLLMRFADCVPVLLHDPRRKVAGIAHAGWMGTVRGTVLAAVEAMRARFGSDPWELLAGIGPSIGPDHYEVSTDVIDQVRQAFGGDSSSLLDERDGLTSLDLWAANRLLLERAGVKHLEVAGLCTVCHNEDWFSHRAEKGSTGRFGAALALG